MGWLKEVFGIPGSGGFPEDDKKSSEKEKEGSLGIDTRYPSGQKPQK